MHAFLPAGGASGTADVASDTGGGDAASDGAAGGDAGGGAGATSKNHYILLTELYQYCIYISNSIQCVWYMKTHVGFSIEHSLPSVCWLP